MSRDSILKKRGPARALLLVGLPFVALATCGAPIAPETRSGVTANVADTCGTVAEFYRTRPNTKLWTSGGKFASEASLLQEELRQTSSSARAENLEQRLSQALVRRAQTLAVSPDRNIHYVDETVVPRPPCPSTLLERAAASPSLKSFLAQLEAPNALARSLLASGVGGAGDSAEGKRDLALARLVGSPARAVVVDTTSAQLWTIENGNIADSMKVVVGKPAMKTPQMAALIRFAAVNPYWNVPPDLVRVNWAPRVASLGPQYLAQRRYEAVDRYGTAAQRLDPAKINWSEVKAGKRKVGIRQLPGPDNMMGAVKFMFPNRLGIYLHDTPHRWAFDRADRRISSGCVRVERAGDLYRWLLGHPLPAPDTQQPERRVYLSDPVPVYLVTLSPRAAAVLTGKISDQV